MKKTAALFVSLTISLLVLSQAPGVHWQRNLGNNQINNYFLTVKTIDNGIISVWNTGTSGSLGTTVTKLSSDGVKQWETTVAATNITGLETVVSYYYNGDGSIVILGKATHQVYDYYVAKLDNNGNLLWENWYGGTEQDVPSSIIKSINGGYLIIGNSISPEITHDANMNLDAWLIKISETGVLQWQKDLGGNGNEGTSKYNGRGKVVESSDGSIYMLTETTSTEGDVTGNHGGQDIWLVKLNSIGAIQWTKCLGGTGLEYSSDLKLSQTGNLYVLGSSASPEFTVDRKVQADFFFAIVSPDGDSVYQKCFGSAGNEVPAQIVSTDIDGSCVLAGTARYNGYDIVYNHGEDIWIFKLNQGVIFWQQCIGGAEREVIYRLDEGVIENSITGGVIQTADGGYFISAQTDDDVGDITGLHGSNEIFTAKISSTGAQEWIRPFGGYRSDLPKGSPIELFPGVFVAGGLTYSNDGDVQRNFGGGDPWLVKIGPVNTIGGRLFLDINSDGIKDDDEPPFSLAKVNVNKEADNWTVVPLDGSFSLRTDSGNFVTSVSLDHPYYTVVPAQHNSSFSGYFNIDTFNFAIQPIPGTQDLVVNVIPSVARPGFTSNYEIFYRNVGNVTISSAQVLFKKDPRGNLISSTPAISSSAGDTLKWDLSTLGPGTSGTISFTLQLDAPPTLNIGDTLTSLALITPVAGDITPNDDTALVKQLVRGSLDPNDKAENHGGGITTGQIMAGEYLNYIVRFQNMGTDTAFNIVVRDTLDNKLAWSTFEMVGASHPYQLQINNSNQLVWTFNDIELPHSAQNEPASHGYIAYRIKPASNVQIGNTISNEASIYFDFNLPVQTNIASTIVGTPIALPLHLVDFSANYRKPDALLEWSTADESNVDKFIIERGTDPVHFVPVGTVAAKGNSNSITRYQFKDGLAGAGGDKFYYRLKMMDIDQKFSYSNIQLVKREGRAVNELEVNPNPIRGRFGFAWINLQKESRADIGVIDMKGNYRSLGQRPINKGFNVVPLDFYGLSDGTYLLQVKIGQERLISRFVLVQ